MDFFFRGFETYPTILGSALLDSLVFWLLERMFFRFFMIFRTPQASLRPFFFEISEARVGAR